MIPAELATLDQIQRAHDQARDELRRADTKATTLLSLVGAALAGVIALTTRQIAPAALLALWIAAAPIGVSVLLLLSAIRPRLSKTPTRGTWLDAAINGPEALLYISAGSPERRGAEALASHAALLGRIALTKYLRVGYAVSLLLVGLTALAVALVLSVLL